MRGMFFAALRLIMRIFKSEIARFAAELRRSIGILQAFHEEIIPCCDIERTIPCGRLRLPSRVWFAKRAVAGMRGGSSLHPVIQRAAWVQWNDTLNFIQDSNAQKRNFSSASSCRRAFPLARAAFRTRFWFEFCLSQDRANGLIE